MNEEEPSFSERYISAMVIKFAILLTIVVVLLGLAATIFADRYQSLAQNSLLFCFALFALSYALLSILHAIDWFEARKAKRNG